MGRGKGVFRGSRRSWGVSGLLGDVEGHVYRRVRYGHVFHYGYILLLFAFFLMHYQLDLSAYTVF